LATTQQLGVSEAYRQCRTDHSRRLAQAAADERCDLGLEEVAMIFEARFVKLFSRTQEDTSYATAA